MGTNARASGPWSEAVAATIRGQAALRDWAITQLADRAGIPIATLRKSLKYGRPIDMEELGKIAMALDMKVSELTAEAERTYVALLKNEGTPMGESLRMPLTALKDVRPSEEPGD